MACNFNNASFVSKCVGLFGVILLSTMIGVDAGCREGRLCCGSKNNTCIAAGPRMNDATSKTCFCDESCLYGKDCCTDYSQVCAPVDCVATEWQRWGPCSTACGHGRMDRRRRVLQHARNGGKNCPQLMEKSPCQGNRCPYARQSSAHNAIELKESAKIIPATFASSRLDKLYNPYLGIRKNLFHHYAGNKIFATKSPYCARFEVSRSHHRCTDSKVTPWARQLRKGATVCVECQQYAMKEKLGGNCRGHGVFQQETRWHAALSPSCHGAWIMVTKHEDCKCDASRELSFILV